MNLEQLNLLPDLDATKCFEQCCVSEKWIQGMVNARPFASEKEMQFKSKDIWRSCEETDFLQAFSGHPKIGDVASLQEKYQSTSSIAAAEQGLVAQATEQTIQSLAEKNTAYEEKFGFIFIVCATGKSAEEMLTLLVARLPNERGVEINIAAAEQLKITQLRLEKLFKE